MTRLLVSVQNAGEAELVWQAGADIIDVKHPGLGSLGAQPPEVVLEIVRRVPGAFMTMALGDLPLWPGTVAYAVRGALALTADVQVKVGLVGPYDLAGVRGVFDVLRDVSAARVIPAFYLDQVSHPDQLADLCQLAAQAGHRGIVWDTLSKATAWYRWLNVAQLTTWAAFAHSWGLWVGLAGHMDREHVSDAVRAGVDVVGVRSAVTEDGRRTSRLSPDKVRQFKQALLPVGQVP
jgi:uncharacterized protein (UPF0264 family)